MSHRDGAMIGDVTTTFMSKHSATSLQFIFSKTTRRLKSRLQMTSSSSSLLFFLLVWTGLIPGRGHAAAVDTVVVKEGDDVILPCSLDTREDLKEMVFEWEKDGRAYVFLYDRGKHFNNVLTGQSRQFRGRVSFFEEEVKNSNVSIKIHNTKMDDAGNYTCRISRHSLVQRFNVELVVYASSAPDVTIVDATEDGVLLRCDVQGAFPKPEVEWQDGDGNVLRAQEPGVASSGNRYDVTLLATVTKTTTNRFRCVVKHETIDRQTERDVYVPEKLFESRDVTNLLLGCFIVSLTANVAVVVCVCVRFRLIRKYRKRNAPDHNNHNGSDPGQEQTLMNGSVTMNGSVNHPV